MQRFLDDYVEAYRHFLDEALAFAEDTHPQPTAVILTKPTIALRVHMSVLNKLLETTSFLRLQYSFERAVRTIVCALVIATVGAAAFASPTSGS